jgi:hypothetical protein
VNDHELEQRLRRVDPMPPGVTVDPVDGPRARALLEKIMSAPPVEAPAPPSRRRWPVAAWAGAAAAAAIVVAVVAIVAVGGSSDDDEVTASFALQPSDPMAMCMAIDEMPPPGPGAVAFGGTVTEVTDSAVTIDVDRMYSGDELDTVTLTTGPDVTTVALDGVEFVGGERYLVTVVDGVVGICGMSGPATPELEAVYDRWFPAG